MLHDGPKCGSYVVVHPGNTDSWQRAFFKLDVTETRTVTIQDLFCFQSGLTERAANRQSISRLME
jgi:hypothetical protein